MDFDSFSDQISSLYLTFFQASVLHDGINNNNDYS